MHKGTRTATGEVYGTLEQAGHGEVDHDGDGEPPRRDRRVRPISSTRGLVSMSGRCAMVI